MTTVIISRAVFYLSVVEILFVYYCYYFIFYNSSIVN